MCGLRQEGSSECTEELLSLAHGSDFNAHSYGACIVNGVRFVVHSRDIQRTTQNSGVSVPGIDGFTFYGQLEEIIELQYLNGYSVVLFRCKWFNTDPNKGRCVTKNNITSINVNSEWYKDDQFIFATQAKQVFYIEDPSQSRNWRVVEDVNHRKIWDHPSIDVVNEIDVVHDNSSSDFVLIVDLGELPCISLERRGQSSLVDDVCIAPVVDNEDFINDEDGDEDEDEDEDVDLDDAELSEDNDNANFVAQYRSSDESD